jgi:hypothetical protein
LILFNKDFLIIFIIANSDGVSPDKATSKGYWTLLIMPVNLPVKIVIPVSLTFGRGYPPDLEWFERGIEQIVELLNFTTECGVKFTLRNIICDLPAGMYIFHFYSPLLKYSFIIAHGDNRGQVKFHSWTMTIS